MKFWVDNSGEGLFIDGRNVFTFVRPEALKKESRILIIYIAPCKNVADGNKKWK